MKELLESLSKFQEECPILYKDKVAKQEKFSYKYVDLPSIITIINPLLKKNGLVFTQSHTTYEDERGVPTAGVKTILWHIKTGQSLVSEISSEIIEMRGMNKYQSLGSLSTYLRRYDLSALLGLVTEKDTDANSIELSSPKPKPSNKATPVKEDKPIKRIALKEDSPEFKRAVEFLKKGGKIAAVEVKYTISAKVKKALDEVMTKA